MGWLLVPDGILPPGHDAIPEHDAVPEFGAVPDQGAVPDHDAVPGHQAETAGSPGEPAPAGPRDQARPAADPAGRAQLAREALLRAKADSAARGNWPARPAGRAAGSPQGSTGRRPHLDDPETLNSAIAGLIDARGWQLAAAAGSVFGRWEEIVGPELAAHTRPDGFEDGELTVAADSTAWATQVRLLAATLVRRLNTELGDGAVRRVKVRGPAAPKRPGQWRVRDSRGPRDTYG
jgi:predicted nucleic acid-binding Zn ribbon protein